MSEMLDHHGITTVAELRLGRFPQWTPVTLAAAAVICITAGVFCRSRNVYLGVVLGVLLAGVVVLCGLFFDLVGSGGLA